ncbi:MAG: S8 family serine peptidase, partial [Pseudomonadota bacterium]|nr:S8 family serine peptidase [Pseudomonadota bacterium]
SGMVVITATNPGDNYYNSDSSSYEFKTSITPVAKGAKFEQDLMPKDISTKCGTLSATDEEGDALTYVVVSNGSLGTATFSKPTESLVCYSTNSGLVSAGLDSFTYKVSDGVSDSNVATVQWDLHTDPLYVHQWHLENKGQSNFASSNGKAGEDIQVAESISNGYTGKSVTVAVVDSGLEIDHEDLSSNVVPGGSYNFVDDSNDPTSSSSSGDHGTAVAGLIGSRGWNDLGGRGVAPKVSLKGFNFLKKPSMANHLAALGGGEYAKDVDIFNMSYGSRADFDRRINSALEAQLKNGVTALRETKGALYIKSAGNGFNSFKKEDGKTVRTNCKLANAAGISCQNANMDPGATTPYTIIVGALNADGVKTHYSTAGANIWVSAPGGSGGYDMNHTALSCGESCAPYLSKPAMMSTDQMSCEKGLVRSQKGKGRNPFQDGSGSHSLNPNCNYTSRMNGTSASAPVVSGSLALILEANPNLTWRDVKHILVTTAALVDSERTATMVTLGDGTYAAEEGWVTNAAGLRFHNWYGFGGLDVSAAIELLKGYTAGQLGSFLESGWIGWQSLSDEIPDNNSSGYEKKISILGSMINNISVIEAVQLRVSANHSSSGDLGFELVSPSGTKSILLNVTNGFSETDNLNSMVLLSNAFYGESPHGEWTVKVVDGSEGISGVLTSVHLRFFGRSSN